MEAALRYQHVASLVFDQPLMIAPRKAEMIARYLAARIAGAALSPFLAVPVDGSTRRDRQNLTIQNGVAVIDVTGVLVHRSGQMDAESTPLLSYEQIGLELDAAIRGPEVRGILLRIDSEGGEVSGVFDLADKVFNARKAKPVWAIASDQAASAAYLLASAAERVIVTQSALIGSIGVVFNRLDITKALEADGVQVIQIAQGARKLDGSPVQPWKEGSEEDKALQRFTASYYDMFVNAVARNRGLLAEVVRNTDAAVYVGAAAVEAGLATKVGTIELAVNELRALTMGRPLMTTARNPMDDNPTPTPAPAALTREQIEQQYPTIVEAIRADARKPVPLTAEQERERVLAIQALQGTPALTTKAVSEAWSPEKMALEMRKADVAARQNRIAALREDDTQVGTIAPSAAGGEPVAEPEPRIVAAKARHYVAEQAKQGLSVTIAEAVAHVRQSLGLPLYTTPGA